MEVSLLKVVTDFGVKVNTSNREAFVKASDPIYKEFATDVKSGATLVSKILELAKAK
jgi:TRAP-type C4-dicarboxylate transport system substrate-binding protein